MKCGVEMFTKGGNKFLVLPQGSIFNDYQVLFDLKSNIAYNAWQPDSINNDSKMKLNEHYHTKTMNIDCDKFNDLCELYRETAENLKLRALEKRSIYMYYKRKTELRNREISLSKSRQQKDGHFRFDTPESNKVDR